MTTWDDSEISRYGRQMLLPGWGGKGQARLRASSVLVVGAGGLGSPAALYLAASGVGRIGIIDPDDVELSNLHRQILHTTESVGRPKTESAARMLGAVNPAVAVEAFRDRLTESNARALVERFDLVVDGADDFETRFAANDACVAARKFFVHAGVARWFGQIFSVVPGETACYRCLFRSPPPPGSVPTCAEAGIAGPVTGVLGSLQAAEALKLLLGIGSHLGGRLLTVDVSAMRFRDVEVRRDPDCPACGAAVGAGSGATPLPVGGVRVEATR